jgi:hypothetical protein
MHGRFVDFLHVSTQLSRSSSSPVNATVINPRSSVVANNSAGTRSRDAFTAISGANIAKGVRRPPT